MATSVQRLFPSAFIFYDFKGCMYFQVCSNDYLHTHTKLVIHIYNFIKRKKLSSLSKLSISSVDFEKKNHFTFVTNVKPQSTFNKYKAVLLTLAWSFPFFDIAKNLLLKTPRIPTIP